MKNKRYIEACELAEVIENLDIRVAGQSARWYDAKHSVLCFPALSFVLSSELL